MSAVHPPVCPACCIVKFTVNIVHYILANQQIKMELYVYFCVTVIRTADLVTFTAEAREVVYERKTENIGDRTKLTRT